MPGCLDLGPRHRRREALPGGQEPTARPVSEPLRVGSWGGSPCSSSLWRRSLPGSGSANPPPWPTPLPGDSSERASNERQKNLPRNAHHVRSTKQQVSGPCRPAQGSPRTPHDASSERCRPEHVTEKPRPDTLSRLDGLRGAAWSVKRASLLAAGAQAARATSPIGSTPASCGRRLTRYAPHHPSVRHRGPWPPTDNIGTRTKELLGHGRPTAPHCTGSSIADPASPRGGSYGAMADDRGVRAPVVSGQTGRPSTLPSTSTVRRARPCASGLAPAREVGADHRGEGDTDDSCRHSADHGPRRHSATRSSTPARRWQVRSRARGTP